MALRNIWKLHFLHTYDHVSKYHFLNLHSFSKKNKKNLKKQITNKIADFACISSWLIFGLGCGLICWKQSKQSGQAADFFAAVFADCFIGSSDSSVLFGIGRCYWLVDDVK